MSNNDWYRYHAPRRLVGLTLERIAADSAAAEHDIDAVLERTELAPDARILEVGCGWGRHSLALARHGFTQVCSIDIAPEPLTIAAALASERGLRCDFQLQDFLGVRNRPFAAILSLYDRSVCGFPSEAEDQQSLHHLAGLLAPGGWLVFGINDWPFHLPEPRRDWRETSDGIELIEVTINRAALTCTDRTTLIRPDGQRDRYDLTRRHYVLPELVRLLNTAGFTLTAAQHRLVGRPYGTGEDGLFVYARKECP
ncbi:MAG: class I SAM-dependent methyltransferase [Oscillochloridaceae bacterium umkhey_bin13]